MTTTSTVDGVVFDLDGVIIDSEHLWEAAWASYCEQAGTQWTHEDTLGAQGMSLHEWSAYVARRAGRPEDATRAGDYCVGYVIDRIVEDGEGAPLPGARDLVAAVSARVPIALASSAARRAIDAVLAHHDLASLFTATVSSEEVAKGKPSPDVYLEAVRRLGLDPQHCVAVEDSTNGILAAHAARLIAVAIPNATYPPRAQATDVAAYVATDHADAGRYIASLIGERSTHS